MSKKKLKERLSKLRKERNDILNSGELHGKYAEMAAMAISDIEFEIAAVEDCLDFERRMIPFKVGLYAFIIISVGLIAYAIFK